MSGVHAGHPGAYRTCGHTACTTHRKRYLKQWQYERAQGKKRTADATPARARIEELRQAGWSIRSIAGEANIAPTTVSRVARGLQVTITVKAEQQILALNPAGQLAARSYGRAEPFVPNTGTRRRIQALIALGWRHSDMHERCGITTHVALHQKGNWVTRTTHDAIRSLYADLCMTPGPSTASRGRAARLGYAPPLAWDDIDHDPAPNTPDPGPERDIDQVAIARRLAGDTTIRLNRAEKAEALTQWRASGRPLSAFERTTGINPHRKSPTKEEGTAA